MSLFELVGLIALIAVGVSIVSALLSKPQSWFVHYLRNFLGVFFIFSGVVKAIDPIGTQIKMEEYFTVFTDHFPMLTSIWEILGSMAFAFSIIMIVLEIILGISLILGTFKKSTLFLYLGIILFFTVLTGFSFLTGYVPDGATFLEFSQWTEFKESQRKVTDCGCFGEFVKLKPFESFIKDVVLTVLILILIALAGKYKLITKKGLAYGLLGVLSIATLLFTFRNVNNLPIVDFRAYAEGTNLRDCTNDEGLDPGERDVKFVITKGGEEKTVGMNDFGKFSKEGWEYKDRIDVVIREPELPPCKDFLINTDDGDQIQDQVLGHTGVTFFVNSYDVTSADKDGFKRINDLVGSFSDPSIKKYGVTGTDIAKASTYTDGKYEFYNLDATPIKTMNRSNPGLSILKDGVLVKKYHHNHLPSVEEVKSMFKM